MRLKVCSIRLAFFLFAGITLGVSCSQFLATPIADLLANPRQYEGKVVAIEGQVVDSQSLLVVKYFTLKDKTGQIRVITNRALPQIGQSERVRGKVDEAFFLATNRPLDLDEAMHRRITLPVEFRNPDPHLRRRIWEVHLPAADCLEGDIDLGTLAMKYELNGGYIKNAILTALSLAVARDSQKPRICQEDLERGAQLQLRTRLAIGGFDRRVTPKGGLDTLVFPEDLQRKLREIVIFKKARNVLFGQWGFDEHMTYGQGYAAIFSGPPGTGKSAAAEAIGFETGKPLKVINYGELLSKYVGDTPKNIEGLFKDAAAS